MGISRDSRHKRSASGAKRAAYRKKRAFELGRQPANTRIGPKRIHTVRTRGGNHKYRALRLDSGNFAWASEGCTRKTRVIVVVYHASNNELVRTNTLTKSAIIQVDAAPFRQWYEAHYGQPIGRRKQKTQAATAALAAAPTTATTTTTTTPVKKDAKDAKAGTKGGKDSQTAKENTKDAKGGKEGKQDGEEHKQSKAVQQKLAKRFADRGKVDPALEKQFESGRLYAAVTSRPGQSGRVDGQILEGAELAFYLRKLTHK